MKKKSLFKIIIQIHNVNRILKNKDKNKTKM